MTRQRRIDVERPGKTTFFRAKPDPSDPDYEPGIDDTESHGVRCGHGRHLRPGSSAQLATIQKASTPALSPRAKARKTATGCAISATARRKDASAAWLTLRSIVSSQQGAGAGGTEMNRYRLRAECGIDVRGGEMARGCRITNALDW
jgi:hypothetical protein